MKKSLLTVITLLILVSCSSQNHFVIRDIIKPVNIVAGVPETFVISDLFYADNYDIDFGINQNLDIKYDKENLILTIKSHDGFQGITLLGFTHNGDKYVLPVKSKVIQKVRFAYTPEKDYEKVSLFGSFNDWNRHNLPMKDSDGDGTYETTVLLEPGIYQYKFFGDGEEIIDPANPDRTPNGFGSFNSVIEIDEQDTTESYLHILGMNEDAAKISYEFYYERSDYTREVTYADLIPLLNNKRIESGNIEIDDHKITVAFNKADVAGKNTFRLAVSDHGKATNMQTVFMFDGMPADNETAFMWYDAVIYSLMIDRFNDGDESLNNPVKHDSLLAKANYMGGDLQGVIDKLNEGYFDNLGINTIWISPVYDNPNQAYREYPEPHRYYSGYHGYWPIHHQKVEEKFGTMDKLKELINIAHQHDIKILLDFVSNHVHEQHPFFKEHRSWFGELDLPDGRKNLRMWDEFRLTTWFEPYLPSFDYEGSDSALTAMTDNAIWWLTQTGADGYRHDAVKHVPNKFWRSLTERINEEIEVPQNKEVYQIGETFGSYDLISSYVNNGQLDAQFNFNLYDVAQVPFVSPNESFENLNKELRKTFDVYGELHLMGNIMDSHDKNRYMAYADGDLELSQWSAIEEGWNNPPKVDDPESYEEAELYYAYMNTIPGLPVIYYGSEFGMTGASDPDNRRMMRFGGELSEYEKEMLEDVSGIINLRKEHPALRYGDFMTLQADENIFAYVRSDMNERLLIVLNKSDDEQTVEYELPAIYELTKAEDLTSGEETELSDGSLKLSVGGKSWRVFSLK